MFNDKLEEFLVVRESAIEKNGVGVAKKFTGIL